MTRPAGSTPNGLPYPGSAEIHARTPAALQALAEAIESKLTAIAPGIILDVYRGPVHLTNFGASSSSFAFAFPNLATCQGRVGVAGVDQGTGLVDGFIGFNGIGASGYFNAAPWVKARPPADITLHAVGWGPPKT